MKKLYKHTKETLRLYKIWQELNDAKGYVIKPRWFKTHTVKEILVYLEAVGKVNADFWLAVYDEYPELNSDLIVSADARHIKVKSEVAND